MLKTFDPKAERDLVFIPVGINYDRVLEDRTLLMKLDPAGPRRGLVYAVARIIAFAAGNLWLMATGRWAVIAAAGMTVIALCAATAAAFGSKVWLAFLDSTALTREIVLEAGSTGWERIQSIFSAVRMWGGTIEMAYAAQCALTLTVAVALVWVSRSKSSSHLKSAALAASTLIATPYVLDYDLMILGIALAFFARHCLEHGFHDYEISTLSFVWTAPLLSRLAGSLADVPLGLMAQVMLFAAVLLRAYRDVRAPQPAAAWQTPMLHLHGRELRNAE